MQPLRLRRRTQAKKKKKADAQALRDKEKKKKAAGKAKRQQTQDLAAAMWGNTTTVSVGCTWLQLDPGLWMREFSVTQAKEMIKFINQVVYSSFITHELPSIRVCYLCILP